ncbi:hypothetical protein EBU71_10220 [bacterium]|nr:hypothetical protein [Candidatus Elulimicrobium humile]
METIQKFRDFSVSKTKKKYEHLIGKELKFGRIVYRDDNFRKDSMDFRKKYTHTGVIRDVLDWDLYNEPLLIVECPERVYRITYETSRDIFHIFRYYLPNQIVGKRNEDKKLLEEFKQIFWGQIIEIDKMGNNQYESPD